MVKVKLDKMRLIRYMLKEGWKRKVDKSLISTKAFSVTPKGVIKVSKMGRNVHWSKVSLRPIRCC